MATSILDLNSERTAEAGVEVEDLRLIESLREGAECAYEELLTRFQQPVYTLALRLLNDPSEACDVVQEVFLKVFRNMSTTARDRASCTASGSTASMNRAISSTRRYSR